MSWLVVSVGLVLGGVGTANVLADPSGVWAPLGLDALEPDRMAPSRTTRGEQLRQGDWQVLLLGTSRILLGISPEDPAFGDRRVLNAGLKGTNLYELRHLLDYAMATNELEEVFLFLDFHAFSGALRTAGDFDASRLNPAKREVDYRLEKLFGMRSLRESITVAKRHWRDRPTAEDKNARRRQIFDAMLEDFATNPTLFGGFRGVASRVEILEDMLAANRAAGIRTTIVILPVHATFLETIRVTGLWDAFEQWKRDVVRTARESQEGTGASVPVWDFTDYDAFSTEAFDATPEAIAPLRWFRDPSHINRDLGDRVLARIAGEARATDEIGVRLDETDLDRHLARVRANRDRYATENPREVAWVESLVTASRP